MTRLYVAVMTCSEVDMHDDVLAHAKRDPAEFAEYTRGLMEGWKKPAPAVIEEAMRQLEEDPGGGFYVEYGDYPEVLRLEIEPITLEEDA